MSLIKYVIGAFAFTWAVAILSACGPVGQASSSSLGSSRTNDAATHLFAAQSAASNALPQAGVVPIAPAASQPGSNCQLAVQNQNGQVDPTQIFSDLQAKFQTILADVQNQDPAALTADLQAVQQSLIDDINGLIGNIQACLPTSSNTTANLPANFPGSPGSGLQGLDLTQILGQLSGAP